MLPRVSLKCFIGLSIHDIVEAAIEQNVDGNYILIVPEHVGYNKRLDMKSVFDESDVDWDAVFAQDGVEAYAIYDGFSP